MIRSPLLLFRPACPTIGDPLREGTASFGRLREGFYLLPGPEELQVDDAETDSVVAPGQFPDGGGTPV